MNSDCWDNFESFDCEEADKVHLRRFKKELNTWKKNFEEKDTEPKRFLQRVEAAQREVTERMDKKRKMNGGDAVGSGAKEGAGAGAGGGGGDGSSGDANGGSPGGDAAAASAAGPSEEALKQVAER
eukprot:6637628-Pyramimonas_sp.AAC.1